MNQYPRVSNPTNRTTVLSTVALATIVSVGLNVPAAILMRVFEFPGILRRPAIDALTLFAKHATIVIPTYYAFALASLALIPLAILMRALLDDVSSPLLSLATTLGVFTGLTQAIGFLRWPFMEPALVSMYFAQAATPATREAVLVVHDAFNRFAGVAIGEHLGWLLNGSWLLTLGVYAIRRPTRWLPMWAGTLTAFCGVCTLVSSAEQFGIESPVVGAAFYAGYVLWTVLLFVWAVGALMHARRSRA